MLGRIDRVFALVTWVVAGVLVVMLLFGPALVAHDAAPGQAAGYTTGTSTSGGHSAAQVKALFVSKCGSCHTLAAAGTTGQVGPNLDQVSLTQSQVAAQISQGGGGMPAFAGQLNQSDINALAAFVAQAR